MNDYKTIIERLKKENEMTSTTDSQREANKHRIKQLELFNRPKIPETTYVRLDPVRERLKDDSFTVRPRHFLVE